MHFERHISSNSNCHGSVNVTKVNKEINSPRHNSSHLGQQMSVVLLITRVAPHACKV